MPFLGRRETPKKAQRSSLKKTSSNFKLTIRLDALYRRHPSMIKGKPFVCDVDEFVVALN